MGLRFPCPRVIAAGLHRLADTICTPDVGDFPAPSDVQDARLYPGRQLSRSGTTRQPTNGRSKGTSDSNESNGRNGNGKARTQPGTTRGRNR
jgi:hypothetical protein